MTCIETTDRRSRKRCRSNNSINDSYNMCNNDSCYYFPTTTPITPFTHSITNSTSRKGMIGFRVSSTLLTLFLISSYSVHCFQPARAAVSSNDCPSSHYNHHNFIKSCKQGTNDRHSPTIITSQGSSTITGTSSKKKPTRKNYCRLSASTTIPPSSGDIASSSTSLFFRDYNNNHSNNDPTSNSKHTSATSIARLPDSTKSSSTTTIEGKNLTTGTSHVITDASSAICSSNRQRASTSNTVTTDARKAWEQKYCSVAGLREAFGTNKNVFYGDFDASITRRLYKCLLPVALLELYETGHVPPQDLAPLAYKARVAAKLYARERSHLPARFAASAFDGYRQWRKYGRFDCTGMSYDQIWNKYATIITQQETSSKSASSVSTKTNSVSHANGSDDDYDDSVTAKICLKILERSCHSNEMIDRLVLKHQRGSNKSTKSDASMIKQRRLDLLELRQVSEQLERDIQLLLQQPDKFVDSTTKEIKSRSSGTSVSAGTNTVDETLSYLEHKQQAQKFRALRAVAKVKRRIALLQKSMMV